MRTRGGVTLFELIVVLVILSTLWGVVTLAMRATPSVGQRDAVVRRVLAARDSAVDMGHPFTISVVLGGREYSATVFPDGRVVADAELNFDPVSGRPRNERR